LQSISQIPLSAFKVFFTVTAMEAWRVSSL
jgi:hypothetical protein